MMNEIHTSILRTQTMMLEQMQEDRANWDYKFTYLIKHSGLPSPPDRLPTNHALCATPSHQLSQGPILQVEQADRQQVNRTGTDGQPDTGSKAQQDTETEERTNTRSEGQLGMEIGDQNVGSQEQEDMEIDSTKADSIIDNVIADVTATCWYLLTCHLFMQPPNVVDIPQYHFY